MRKPQDMNWNTDMPIIAMEQNSGNQKIEINTHEKTWICLENIDTSYVKQFCQQ